MEYKVLMWDVNANTIKWYNILSYIKECWDEKTVESIRQYRNAKRRKDPGDLSIYCMPNTFEGIKAFILKECQYQFWSRCQYEIMVDGFPESNKPEKIDVYDQIEANIDVITTIFITNEHIDCINR